MDPDPMSIGSRILNACIAALLGAMALYGAVVILQAIWVYLCIGLAVAGVGALLWWWITTRCRGW